MGVPVIWICSKCGKKVSSSQNPATNNTSYTKCPKSSSGEHKWQRK